MFPTGKGGRVMAHLFGVLLVIIFGGLTLVSALIPRAFKLMLARIAAWCLSFYIPSVVKRNLNVINRYRREELNLAEIDLRYTWRQNLFFTLKNAVDFFHFMILYPQSIDKVVIGKGNFNELQSMHQEGQAIVGVCMHMGNWEVGGLYLANVLDVNFSSLFFKQLNPGLNFIMNLIRKRCNIGLLHQRGGLKGAVKALRRGEMITLLGDQDGTRNGLFLRFLGLICSFPRAAELFAAEDVLFMPMVIYHDGPNYSVKCWNVFPKGIAGDELIHKIADFYQSRVAESPEQWLLLYDRFKFRHDSKLKEMGIYDETRREYEIAWKNA
jgi:KDO2-lipid IV(A) lauroyltransferase